MEEHRTTYIYRNGTLIEKDLNVSESVLKKINSLCGKNWDKKDFEFFCIDKVWIGIDVTNIENMLKIPQASEIPVEFWYGEEPGPNKITDIKVWYPTCEGTAKHVEEMIIVNGNVTFKEERRQKGGYLSMYENKDCASYFGVVIEERLCRHLFKDVEMMPMRNPSYDIICNKGKKIDVKTSSTRYNNGKYPHWGFDINENKIADYFIFVAFNNRTDLNSLHLWMIPGHEINENASKSIGPTTLHKWKQWERNIKDAQLCCNEMRNK